MKRKSRWRAVRAIMYALLVFAGIAAILAPSQLVQDQVGGLVVFFWSSFMTASAGVALYGALTDKWIGEYTGLPLLSITLFLYGISATISAGFHPSPLFAYGLVVVAFSVGLVARWLDAGDEKKRSEIEEWPEETRE